ncbi:sugar ABC transporter [Siccirubricoccus deserti]|uniref:ATP-binding cassette domain-containing protein n=1 Tax=Siccirubricoccus deserti TaxID=2013562 RepID=A0A9X0QWR1_9PROT|nr:ATP-binding cassette domain-containing protein [Siccirubricoccus deserti]MBC4015389.1 ATP-binding cassette domain-containing protein [Siccirubricoccus deserti]GGC41250.1 sugar ABC transporter [Siccirubricoccus deserti]
MATAEASLLLELRGIVAEGDAAPACRGIDLGVTPGSVVGLLGAPGSGRRALMRGPCGLRRPAAGTMLWRGQPHAPRHPADALAAGIALIQGQGSLVGTMSVTENLMLGWPEAGRLLRRVRAERRIAALAAEHRLVVAPEAMAAGLSPAARLQVAMLRAVLRGAALLVLEEPTEGLAPIETTTLFGQLRALAGRGYSVVLVSRRPAEVAAVCDSVVVLRDGRVAGQLAGAVPARLAALMGDPPPQPNPRTRTSPYAAIRLGVSGLVTAAAPGVAPLAGLSLAVRQTEVLGVVGAAGHGQEALAAVIAGVLRPDAGMIEMDLFDARRWSPVQRRQAGLGFLAIDRDEDALVPAMSLAENLALRDAGSRALSRFGWLRWRTLRLRAEVVIIRHRLRAAGPRTPAAALPAGDRRRLALLREVARKPRVLVLLEPCRGLDPGTAAAVRQEVLALREAGCAVLWISTDIEEVRAVSDRVAVLVSGRVVATLPCAEATSERLAALIDAGTAAA